MGWFRKVDTRIWNDAKFAALSHNGKLVFLMILTHPHLTALGAMRATMEGMASELGMLPEAFREAFREALSKGLIEHDEKASYVGIPNFLRYNRPQSPNAVKAWESAIDMVPECELKSLLLQRVKDSLEGMSEAFQEALPEAFRKICRNQEQEQEQEQESINTLSTGVDAAALEAEFVHSWNQTPGVRTIRGNRLTDNRRRAFRARIKDPSWDWRRALGKFPLRCFDQADDWKPDADWFLKPDSVTAILEGRYDWTKAKTNGHSKAALRGREVQDDFAHLA